MSTVGLIALLVAFSATAISILALIVGHALKKRPVGSTLSWAGRLAAVISCVCLTVACGVMVYCFLVGDCSIQYVLDNHVLETGVLGTLYRISGLWAGRAGSLMFWAWLISLFATFVAIRRMGKTEPMDNMAVLIMQLVLIAFVGVMLFSEDNMPFTVTDSQYFDDDGKLNTAASMLGMNTLLQHWAMAIHPPMLFLGYAGLTVPFAYAISACIVNNPSKEWVLRCERFAVAAWMFLTVGIGLGAVWAYEVLGWGGYWGWDPVENASLLPWLVAVALIHSFTVYKNRGMFKRWAVMCACLAFCFCIVGTFITRSGLVESVHAFAGDTVSLVLFGALIVVSVLMGIIACIARRKSFVTDENAPQGESMFSKDGFFFINNVIMVLLAFVLCYLTVAQALPDWLPYGGNSVATATYNVIARPIGAVYLLIMALCPLLGWCKTNPKRFFKKALIPGICALVLFALLAVYWGMVLVPSYDAVVAAGDSNAEAILEQGPSAYYNGLALFCFFVGSLLIFNSGCQLVGVAKTSAKRTHYARGMFSRVGSCVSHLAMGVIVIGLVGSSMYVTEVSGYMPYDQDNDTSSERFSIGDYELEYKSASAAMNDAHTNVIYTLNLEVYKDGNDMGQVSPTITLVGSTQQQQMGAGVIRLPQEDLFVVYQGVNSDGDGIHLDVRINPFIGVLWVAFGLLVLGMVLCIFGRRRALPAGALGAPVVDASGVNVKDMDAKERAKLLAALQAAEDAAAKGKEDAEQAELPAGGQAEDATEEPTPADADGDVTPTAGSETAAEPELVAEPAELAEPAQED